MPTFTRRTMLGMFGAAAAGTAGLLPSSPAEAARATQAGTVKPLVDAALTQAVAAGLPGLVIGALDGSEEYVAGAGTTAGPDSPKPDGRTVYQLGSVTKTFTALLLAEAVEQRLVRLEDPLARYLPRGLTLPRPQHGEITLRDVATQSSGLPSLPPNFWCRTTFRDRSARPAGHSSRAHRRTAGAQGLGVCRGRHAHSRLASAGVRRSGRAVQHGR
jgi:CubicO group peptidase (beta-lactamase class C family)